MKYISFALVGFWAFSLQAQSNVPEIVSDGLALYAKSGGLQAMAAWLKGSSLEADTSTRMSVTGGMTQIETLYGKMVGSETIRVVAIAPSMRRVYVMLKFERGPVFFAFDCYRTEKEWIISFIDFNTKADKVLPADVFSSGR